MSDLETVEVKIDITAGDDYSLNLKFPVPAGSERVYWASASYGAVEGTAKASSVLVALIPDDAGPDAEILKAAGKAIEQVRG